MRSFLLKLLQFYRVNYLYAYLFSKGAGLLFHYNIAECLRAVGIAT